MKLPHTERHAFLHTIWGLIKRDIFHNYFPAATISLIIIFIIIYLLCGSYGNNFVTPLGPFLTTTGSHAFIRMEDNNPIYTFGAAQGILIFTNPINLYRIFTTIFLHEGLFHIFVNTFGLFIVGINFEYIAGRKKFLLIFFVTAMIAVLVQCFATPVAITLGASGGMSGLIGALGAYIINDQERREKHLNKLILAILIWSFLAIVNNLYVFFTPSLAFLGHAIGLLVGFFIWIL